MSTNYYAILGVPDNATSEQVRSRFLELARQLHPDRFQGPAKEKAEVDFQAITEAFNVLSNPARRREHDQELARPAAMGATGGGEELLRVYMQRGVKAYKERNFSASAENFDRATKIAPSNAKAFFHLALACGQERRWLSRSLVAIRRACELDAFNAKYAKLAGKLHAQAGNFDQAEHYYLEAQKWGGEDSTVEEALAEVRKGRKGKSRFFGMVL